MKQQLIETTYVIALFVGYLGLWGLKRRRQLALTGRDPHVIARPTTQLQRLVRQLVIVLTAAVVLLVIGHASGIDAPGLTRVAALEASLFDHLGLALGIAGLGLCALAQRTMGTAWRVGIDQECRTELVTGGLYGLVRNPTYLGIHLMNAGFWLIWPTAAVALFAFTYFLTMEFQVRAEEDFLIARHGEAYRAYLRRVPRYLPRLWRAPGAGPRRTGSAGPAGVDAAPQ